MVTPLQPPASRSASTRRAEDSSTAAISLAAPPASRPASAWRAWCAPLLRRTAMVSLVPYRQTGRRRRQWPLLRRTAVLGLVLLTAAIATTASPAQRDDDVNLENWVKLDPDDLPESARMWLDKVEVIITDDEEDIFLRLESDQQRDRFIERFWAARDPSPGSPANEYFDEYERRFEHVQRMFGRDTPREGRQTDRGRMYLLLGEPQNIKRIPQSREAVPVEIWFYQADPRLGVPPNFYLAFFQRNGAGELRLYSPLLDGPHQLLNPDGQRIANDYASGASYRPTINEGAIGAAYDVLLGVDAELAGVALSFFPNDVGALAGPSNAALRSEVMISDIEIIPTRIMPHARWALPILTGRIEADVRFETLPIRTRAVPLIDSSGVPFVHYAVMTDAGRLNLNNFENNWYLTFEIGGSVIDEQNRVVTGVMGAAHDPVKVLQADLEEEQARLMRSGPVVYLDRFPAVGGNFNFDIILENNVSHEYGHQINRIEVPSPWPASLRSSPGVLVWDVITDDTYDPFGGHYPFQIGPYTMIPAVDDSFWVDDGIFVFRQLYLPRGYDERITLTYRLESDSALFIDRTEYANPGDVDPSGTVNHGTRLDTSDFPPGEYQLHVDVVGDDRPAEAFAVTLRDPAGVAQRRPFIHITPGPPPTDPAFALDRARQLRTLGAIDEAVELLADALQRTNDPEYLALQVELLLDAGRFEQVIALLSPALIERPNDVGLLTTMAEASANLGNHADAIRFYERVRLTSDEETTDVLNPLASAYYAEERLDKARELFQMSIDLNSEQPQIRRILDQLLGKRPGG